jgi:hypothetical protein
MSKPVSKTRKGRSPSAAARNLEVAEGATAHGIRNPDPRDVSGPRSQSTGGRYGVEEQGQGQLEAEDFYSENHFVDQPEGRNLK